MNSTNWTKVFVLGGLIGIPLVSVFVNVLAFTLVEHKHPDSLVVDNYYRRGLEINKIVNRDKLAKSFHVGADISINQKKGDIAVTLSGDMPFPDMLSLSFTHPTDARLDKSVLLEHQPGGHYTGQIDFRLHSNWYLELSPGETGLLNWRIRSYADIGDEARFSITNL